MVALLRVLTRRVTDVEVVAIEEEGGQWGLCDPLWEGRERDSGRTGQAATASLCRHGHTDFRALSWHNAPPVMRAHRPRATMPTLRSFLSSMQSKSHLWRLKISVVDIVIIRGRLIRLVCFSDVAKRLW
jgi:hypothetical protein